MKKEILIISVVLVLGIFGYIFYDSVSLSPVLQSDLKVASVGKLSSFDKVLKKNELAVLKPAMLDAGFWIEMNPENPQPNQDITFSVGGELPYANNYFYWSFNCYASECVKSFDEGEQTVELWIYNIDNFQDFVMTEKTFYVGEVVLGCESDLDCSSGEYCYVSDGNCYPNVCSSDLDCPSSYNCNIGLGSCVKVVTKNQLSDLVSNSGDSIENNFQVDVMEQYFCEPCESNSDCDSDYCGNGCCYGRYCVDYDGGINSEVIGSAYYCYNGPDSFCGLPWLDSCNGDSIVERYCDDGVVSSVEIPCSGACYYGKCVECNVDEDCDDGLFCNGVESCLEWTCQSSGNPCGVGESCNEDTDSCEVMQTGPLTIHYSPENPYIGQSVQFWATGQVLNDQSVVYWWTFSDIGDNYASSVSRSYDEVGDYGVSLKVLDSSGMPIAGEEDSVTVHVRGGLDTIAQIDIYDNSCGYSSDKEVVKDIIFSDDGQTAWAVSGAGACDEGSIASIDISDPENPFLESATGFAGYPWDMDRSENLIVIAGSNEIVRFFDVSNPSNPTYINSFNFPDDSSRIRGVKFINEHYLYVASELYLYVLYIPDLSSPSPTILDSFHKFLKGGIATLGNYVYVGSIDGPSLLVYDASDPADPVLVNTVPTVRRVFDIDVNPEGSLLAIVERNADKREELGGITLYDISNPESPQIVYQNLDDNIKYQFISLNGNRFYGTMFSAISKSDLSNPSNPFIVPNSPSFENTYPSSVSTQRDLSDPYIYVGLEKGMFGVAKDIGLE